MHVWVRGLCEKSFMYQTLIVLFSRVQMFFVGLIHSCVKKHRSALDDYRDVDSDSSDDDLLA